MQHLGPHPRAAKAEGSPEHARQAALCALGCQLRVADCCEQPIPLVGGRSKKGAHGTHRYVLLTYFWHCCLILLQKYETLVGNTQNAKAIGSAFDTISALSP